MVGLRCLATEQVPKGGCEPHGFRDTTVPEINLDDLPEELNLGTFKKSKVSYCERSTAPLTFGQFTMIFDDTNEVLNRVEPEVAILAGMEVCYGPMDSRPGHLLRS
jgi:hypothetical protein